ncbi:MAG: metallophosphatase family protein, partial [Thiobacillaceae bacterium]|nr:metallophosphatase family protein [Thiobacillaceae bacterium]MDW8324859.1 YfcE family phosphodiesterase [Burkholderiales bacterium]
CILSDSHDHRKLLEHAVEDAHARGAQAVLHCGDVVAPTTLRVLKKFALPVHVIHGNNTGDLHAMHKLAHEPDSVIRYHGQDAVLHLAGRAIFMVHYPHYAAAMALTGDYDLVCCGHDHRVSLRRVENVKGGITHLINPGTVGGVGASPTYVLADLAALRFEVYAVPTAPGEACNTQPVSVHL